MNLLKPQNEPLETRGFWWNLTRIRIWLFGYKWKEEPDLIVAVPAVWPIRFAKGFLLVVALLLALCTILGLVFWWIPVSVIYDWNDYLFFGAWWGWWMFLWAAWVGITNVREAFL